MDAIQKLSIMGQYTQNNKTIHFTSNNYLTLTGTTRFVRDIMTLLLKLYFVLAFQ